MISWCGTSGGWLRIVTADVSQHALLTHAAAAVQDQVAKLKPWRFGSWQHLPPAASISCCRANRSAVCARLRPEAVVPRLVHQLQQAGWPPQLAATDAAAAAATAAADAEGGGLAGGGCKALPPAAPTVAASEAPAGSISNHQPDRTPASVGSSNPCSAGGNGVLSLSEHTPPGEAMASCMQVRRLALSCCCKPAPASVVCVAEHNGRCMVQCSLRRAE